ncbi:MAG: DegT/DnrJ/EryC1/StrS family aminotransferase [Treponema sp.]|jgi:dTDP-4-amino-4,6-dideoxygalactose transaminase|nr:DegT/DnrJ/EryC1/StrS family aminotransferase [Treponema sp.]
MKTEVYSPTIRRKEMAAVLTAMVEEKIGPGEQAKFLIHTAKEKLVFEYCLALRSPVIALQLALKALGLEKGQGVIVSALSPLYCKRVIEDLGLVPLYSDVLPSSACVGRETIERALAARPDGLNVRCIVLHHTLGYLCNAEGIAELGIPIIEDSSQCYGTVIGNPEEAAPTGTSALFTILGLEERNMLTAGGGALLYSANRRDAAVLRGLGELPPEYGLPDMNAALAVVQFREAEKNLLKRKEIANLYSQAVQGTRHKRFIPSGAEYNNYAFPVILETGVKDVKTYARRKDIAVESAFDNTPVGCGIVPPDQCPEAYSLSLRTVLFPLYPRLSKADAGKVAKIIMTLP